MSKVAQGRVLVSQNGAESYRGQSSWSVVLLGWCLYSIMVMHTYLLRHGWGKPRSMSGQMYGTSAASTTGRRGATICSTWRTAGDTPHQPTPTGTTKASDRRDVWLELVLAHTEVHFGVLNC